MGHIKRTYASVLAPIMDDPALAAPRVELTIPREPTSMYEVAAVRVRVRVRARLT